jgi:cyclic beta-1,2-glucan synthetase
VNGEANGASPKIHTANSRADSMDATPSVELETAARSLAREQHALKRAARVLSLTFAPPSVAPQLERARRDLAALGRGDAPTPQGKKRQAAAEWVLDNYYLIRRIARQVEDELPRGFARHLPQLASGSTQGHPRIDALAHALVSNTFHSLDLDAVRRFIDAYQEISPLTIAELWALPTLLRSTVLQHLLRFLAVLEGNGDETGGAVDGMTGTEMTPHRWTRLADEPARLKPLSIDANVGVEHAIRALRVLDTIDWLAFFKATNRVESILHGDPAHVYARMDFATCDAYRKVVETLAWNTGTPESEVASLAIALACEANGDGRRALVGYYLMAEGRAELEARLGYKPVGVEHVRRRVLSRPTLAYLIPLALFTVLPAPVLFAWLAQSSQSEHVLSLLFITLTTLVAMLLFSVVATTITHAFFARLLPPRTLPKLDFKDGIPSDARTLVVIPTLLGDTDDVTTMLRQIELHYLSNPDPQLRFALLTDDVDTTARPRQQQENPLLERAVQGIDALNEKHGSAGHGPFHLLHRSPRWNRGEERFMGWERKRGKLLELNRLLRGDTQTSYARHVGDPGGLLDIRFVITLDSDTELPTGSAHRLVGLLAHPLNRAVFRDDSDQVVAGYTIVQPRIETSPSSERRTYFSRLFAGDAGFDIYTHACSEIYQDLFGSGIYVGKGIYDVDAFTRSVRGRAPDNALVSHDLFEGIHGRTALATDIVLFDGFPETYATYAWRLHRWVRGDWQLLPWLLKRVPSAEGGVLSNRLVRIDRWKIVDNVRRSLISTAVVVLLVMGWLSAPVNVSAWTLGVLSIFLAPALVGLPTARGRRGEVIGRCVLAVTFLVHDASLVIDAVARVIVRKSITRKRLLEWTSAAHTARGIAKRSSREQLWQTMMLSPLVAVGVLILVASERPGALVAIAPLLMLWVSAPEIAHAVSLRYPARVAHVNDGDRRELRLLARRTWRFFESFVGPGDQWLPIDNHQEGMHEQTAHRTSPTNIGLSMLSTLTAYDFGFIGPSELSLRLTRAFESISRLPHYQGHLFNWYDTRNLHALLPRYVSTVDSGNLAGCLLALKQGCLDVTKAPVVRVEFWDGLKDTIDLLTAVFDSVPPDAENVLAPIVTRMSFVVESGRSHLSAAHSTLTMLADDLSPELDAALLGFLESGALKHEPDVLRELRMAIDGLHSHIRQMRRDLDALMPWLGLPGALREHHLVVPTLVGLDDIPALAWRCRDALLTQQQARLAAGTAPAPLHSAGESPSPDLDASARQLIDAFASAESNATALLGCLRDLAERAEKEARGMDFKLLYDGERKLFRIGYNATIDQLDPHHYDLLASEARLASYFAVIKRDVNESHWFKLGRPMTRIGGAPALLSWGGSMFEFLMPGLVMRSQEGTVLAQTSAAVVDAQIEYGAKKKSPWGISESAYGRVDLEYTYQYRSFGVPGLGFKRGLDDDHVITPYASLLAVSLRPRAVLDNMAALKAAGMLGPFGFYEALDMSTDRDRGRFARHAEPIVVRSYMAHHQGMILVALGNFLNARSMIDRFHADAWVETAEPLLNERAPRSLPKEWPIADAPDHVEGDQASLLPHHVNEASVGTSPSWIVDESARPQAFVLSNGRLSSVLTGAGGGGLRWQRLAITRFEPDPTNDDDGLFLYIRDDATRRVWMATAHDGRTTFSMHKVAYHHRRDGISVHVDVALAPNDDVEVRQVTLHNETNQPRTLLVTSAGRPVLTEPNRALSHPAFSSMFIESERVSDLDGILFSRRQQTPEQPAVVVVHRLVSDSENTRLVGDESDRGLFYGRGGTRLAPRALAAEREPVKGRMGTVLDPVMSLTASVELPAKGSVSLAFVTTVGRTRADAVGLARKFGSMHDAHWVFRDAEQECARRLARVNLSADLLPSVQQLYSALLFSNASLRSSPQARALAKPCQSRLWGRGISGDDPIVLLHVRNPEAPVVGDLLAAQRYLRACGVRLDVVLIDTAPSGYIAEGAGSLKQVLAQNGAEAWLDRHGGIFVIPADRLDDDERRHLEASAHVFLDTDDGSLAARLGRTLDMPPKLPAFEATLRDPLEVATTSRRALRFDNGTGGFSDDGREYVIELAPGTTTPAPWCNVLANPLFGCVASESSLGTTWSQNSGENRLTPWRNDPVLDSPAEALFLRDEETAQFWSTTPNPAGPSGFTRVRHGLGYTVYESASHGLEQEMTVFVPPDASLKIVRLRVKNRLARHRRLTATYYAEWVLGTRRAVQRPHVVTEFAREHACLLATSDWSAEFGGRVAFLSSMDPVHAFTTDRTEFLGRHGQLNRPEALTRWGMSGTVDGGSDPCAALQVHIEVAPGDERETFFILGQEHDRETALATVAQYRSQPIVDAAWTRLGTFWRETLEAVRVKTPEPTMDIMLNSWLLYQTISARLFGRTGFYQSSGALGYRDQLQDVLSLLHVSPEVARAHILDAASRQFEEGDVLHWWHPPSGRGVRTRCSDDLLWLPFVTSEYVAATGDSAILEEPVPFLSGEPLRTDEHDRYAQYARSTSTASLFEHCRRALTRGTTAGVHGLPLMGDGDWNDGMNRVGAEGRGESVWLGWFLAATMQRMSTLAGARRDDDEARLWSERAHKLRGHVSSVAWDGEWYVRAFHDDGSRVGSARNRECRIDSIAQSWSVLSQTNGEGSFDDFTRARAAVHAANGHLVRESDRLALLFWPPFDKTLHDPGYIRGYPSGVRENGGQYTHAAAWLGLAYVGLDDGESAERLFRLLNPILRTKTAVDVERYRVEPYVLAADIYSVAPHVGRGGWTWYTGSAAWMWRLGVEGILGIRRVRGQVRIAPCIPPAWDGFEAWVQVGARSVHIVVENPDHVSTGVLWITMDGVKLPSSTILVDRDTSGTHEVVLRMGTTTRTRESTPVLEQTTRTASSL